MSSTTVKSDAIKSVTEKGRLMEELDPRMKFLLVVVISTITFFAPNSTVVLINYSIILMLYILSGLYSSSVKLLVFVCICQLFIKWQPPLCGAIYFFALILIRLMVFYFMSKWMAYKMRIGDFVSALEQMHVPKGIVIMIAVVFRYLPTVKDELYYIRNTMKLRGIGINVKNVFIHPIRTMEYAIIPLILRCLTVADELSVSAMTRGLDLETSRVPYREVKITTVDAVISSTIIIVVVITRVLA